jgi:hypothetical protein
MILQYIDAQLISANTTLPNVSGKVYRITNVAGGSITITYGGSSAILVAGASADFWFDGISWGYNAAGSYFNPRATVLKTVNYTVTNTDGVYRIECDTTAGDMTITLPLKSANVGRELEIVHIKGTNKVIVAPNATDANKITSDGLATIQLTLKGNAITLKESANSGFWESLSEKLTAVGLFHTYGGFGSTDTKIMRFTTMPTLTNTLFTENHASGYTGNTKGLEITIQRTGIYSITFTSGGSTTVKQNVGLSYDSAERTTDVASIANTNSLGFSTAPLLATTGATMAVTYCGYFVKGSILRPHLSGVVPTTAAQSKVFINYIGQ